MLQCDLIDRVQVDWITTTASSSRHQVGRDAGEAEPGWPILLGHQYVVDSDIVQGPQVQLIYIIILVLLI